MKKLLGIVAAVGIFALPLAASAATFAAKDQYASAPQDRVVGSLYVASGNTSIAGTVTRDVFAVGGTISVSGSVAGNVEALGGNITISGPVLGTVRVAGGTVTISGHVSGDVLIGGGSVTLLPGSIIDGDLYMAGGSAVIGGTVHGTVHASVGKKLTISSNARILGTLTYRAPQEATIEDGAVLSSAVNYTPQKNMHLNPRTPGKALWGLVAFVTAARMIMFLGFAVIIVWLRRRNITLIAQQATSEFWKSVGHGVVYLILVPIAAVLLLVSFVGTIFGGMALLVYLLLTIFAKATCGIVLGAWLAKVIKKHPVISVNYTNAILGTILFSLVTLIPVVGWIIALFLFLAVFGVLAQRVKHEATTTV